MKELSTQVFDKDSLLNRAGSFWLNHMNRDEIARVKDLISLTLENNMFNTLDNSVKALSNYGDQIETNFTITWTEKNSITTLTKPGNGKPVPEKNIDNNLSYYYLVPFEIDNKKPLKIKSNVGELLINKDFFLDFNYLWFKQPLTELFNNNFLIVKEASVTIPSHFSYTLQTDLVYKNADVVADHIKNKLELSGLKKASHAVAGLQIIRKGGTLEKKTEFENGFEYEFSSGEILQVPYEHEELEYNKHYCEKTVIENNFLQFYFPERNNPYWYRKINWVWGLSLQNVTNFEGLLLPDQDLFAFTAGQDYASKNGNKVHSRILLVGQFDTQTEYWEEVARRETETGRYFNDVIGLDNESSPNFNMIKLSTHKDLMHEISKLPNTKLVNPIDVYFKHVLKDKVFVVVIDENFISEKEEVINFIYKNSPSNIVPIIRIKKKENVIVDYLMDGYYDNLRLVSTEEGVPLVDSSKILQRHAT